MVNKNVEKRKHQEIFINLNKSMYFTASKQLKPPTFDDFSVVESFFFRTFRSCSVCSGGIWPEADRGGLVPKLTIHWGISRLYLAWCRRFTLRRNETWNMFETMVFTWFLPWVFTWFFVIDGCPAICVQKVSWRDGQHPVHGMGSTCSTTPALETFTPGAKKVQS